MPHCRKKQPCRQKRYHIVRNNATLLSETIPRYQKQYYIVVRNNTTLLSETTHCYQKQYHIVVRNNMSLLETIIHCGGEVGGIHSGLSKNKNKTKKAV